MATASISNTTTATRSAEIALEAFLSNAVWGVAIQDDDEVFRLLYNKSFSTRLSDSENGKALDFDGMKQTLASLRAEISDRREVSESFLTVPADAEGNTGTVAHSFAFTGVKAGEVVKVSIVAVVTVEWSERKQRQIRVESFVLKIE